MIPGIKIEANGKEWIFAPLTLGAIEFYSDDIFKATSGDLNASQIKTVLNLATSSLKRNYPDITREEVGEIVDISNMNQIFIAIMNTSGMVQTSTKEEGEESKK